MAAKQCILQVYDLSSIHHWKRPAEKLDSWKHKQCLTKAIGALMVLLAKLRLKLYCTSLQARDGIPVSPVED